VRSSLLHASLALQILVWIAPATAQVIVTEPWVRATVEGLTATGAYMTISSSRDVTLIGASSDAAGHASVHEMQMHGSTMTMHPVDRLPIPAGHPVALDPGHYHVMLEDLKRKLSVGDRVALDLQFIDAKGARQTVHFVAPVRDLTAQDSGHIHSDMKHE
jgi:hypothetical protein